MSHTIQSPTRKNSKFITNTLLQQQLQNTRTRTQSQAPNSLDSLRKVIKQLENSLKEQRCKRKQTQQKLVSYRQRTIFRENQFFRILEKLGHTSKIQPETSLDDLYKQILDNFDQSNAKALQILQKKYQHNCSTMDRKIEQILNKMNQQLVKTKKMSQQAFQRIKRQIQDILYLATKIQDDNNIYRKKISDMEFKIKVLNQQRNFILGELVSKKKIIAKIYRDKQSKIDDKEKNTKQTSLNSTISVFHKFNGQTKNKRPQITAFTISKQPKISRINSTPNYDQTIKHLKLCLERQKKKKNQLGNIVNELQTRNQQINTAIQQCLQHDKNNNNISMQTLIKSQKLFQVIRDIKKRLSMIENPAINCGWGDQDLNSLLD